jgi:metal-responsive CopG/Arc/MetJ family transcriptional regulator
MAALSLRLPDDLDMKLAREAETEGRPRSELAREAIAEYIARREKERFIADMVQAARALASDPAAREESLQLANDLADDGLDAVVAGERAAGIDADKWWT